MPVDGCRAVVLGVDSKRTHADEIRHLQCTAEGIEQQPRAETSALPVAMDREAREHEERYGMARHAFDDAIGRLGVLDLACDDCIEPDNRPPRHADIGR